MKNPSIQIKELPDTLNNIKGYKPEVERNLKNSLENAETMSVKDIDKLQNELMKQLVRYETRLQFIIEALEQAKKDAVKAFNESFRRPYDNADLKLLVIARDARDREKKIKAAAVGKYFEDYAQKQGVGYLNFDKAGINVTLEESLKSLQARCKRYIDGMAGSANRVKRTDTKFTVVGDFTAAVGLVQRFLLWAKRKS